MNIEESYRILRTDQEKETRNVIYCVFNDIYKDYYPDDPNEIDNVETENIEVPLMITRDKRRAEALVEILDNQIISKSDSCIESNSTYCRIEPLHESLDNNSQSKYYMIRDTDDYYQRRGAFREIFTNQEECKKRFETLCEATEVFDANMDSEIYHDESGNLKIGLFLVERNDPNAIMEYEDGIVYAIANPKDGKYRTPANIKDTDLTQKLDKYLKRENGTLTYKIGNTDAFKSAVKEMALKNGDTNAGVREAFDEIKDVQTNDMEISE